MPESANVAKLRDAYRRWNQASSEGFHYWLDLLADDVKCGSLGAEAPEMEFAQLRSSKEDVRRYFESLLGDWELLHYSVDELIEQGDRVVMLGRCGWRFKKTGRTVESPKADIFRFRDGLVVEFFEFYDTAKAIAATRSE